MNSRNFKHGMSGTLTYYVWQALKRSRGGVCLSWRKFPTFLKDMGPKPSSQYWLFRTWPYQRSCKNNVEWRTYKRPFRNIWQYLTPSEVLACQRHINVICKRGGYDFEAALNELFLQDLAREKNPVSHIHSWIKRYLPKILCVLKKRHGEVQYSDEVKYGNRL